MRQEGIAPNRRTAETDNEQRLEHTLRSSQQHQLHSTAYLRLLSLKSMLSRTQLERCRAPLISTKSETERRYSFNFRVEANHFLCLARIVRDLHYTQMNATEKITLQCFSQELLIPHLDSFQFFNRDTNGISHFLVS